MQKFLKEHIFYNKWLPWALIAIVVLVAALGIIQKVTPSLPKSESLSQEDLVKMVKPAVVRIAQKVTGNYSIPEFEIDLSALTTNLKSSAVTQKKLNEVISGSGFIISQDGYILTNAHVVSKELVKLTLISNALSAELQKQTRGLTEEELQKIFKDEQTAEEFSRKALELLYQNSQFNIDSQVAVLNPSSQKEKIENLFATGFPAEVIHINENFLASNKDVALIKINQVNLPTVVLGDANKVAIGNSVFIFGFPATGDLNKQSPLESTLTQGVISALKFSENRDFKIFQTDAKVSQGSSGGPMFNQQGEVIGLVTFQTDPVLQTIGDNFAFAVPIDLGKSLLQTLKTNINSGAYPQNSSNALNFFHQNRCQKALETFSGITGTTNKHFLPNNYFNPYIKICEQNIAEGASVDSGWSMIFKAFKNFSPFEWFVIIGRGILTAAGALILLHLYRKIKKDEQELRSLESELGQTREELLPQEMTIASQRITSPKPDEETHAHIRQQLNLPHPHLKEYIKEARLVGITDDEIKSELSAAGWAETEITQAFKNP